MQEAREIVNLALNERIEKGIKVRQPLALAKIKKEIREEILEIIKDEINVKEIEIDSSLDKEVILDFELTTELKEEGMARELIRNIQQMRKDLKYSKEDLILLKCEGGNLNQKTKQLILSEVLAKDYTLENNLQAEKELTIYDVPFLIGIKKI